MTEEKASAFEAFEAEEQELDSANDQGSTAPADSDSENFDGAPAAWEQEIADLKAQLLRVHADFDNFRKRTRQEKEDLQLYATRSIVSDLLPIVDNFERALSSTEGNEAATELKTGVEMVHRQVVGLLEKHGVRPMDVVGQPFDPNVHEAVMQEAAEGTEAGLVIQELQKGYEMHGKVLRPAMVKVSV